MLIRASGNFLRTARIAGSARMASPTQFVARIMMFIPLCTCRLRKSVHHTGRGAGDNLRLHRFPEFALRGNLQIDHRHEYRRRSQLSLPEILRVFFRGNQSACARLLRRLYEGLYIGGSVTMVIRKSPRARDRNVPVLQVKKKGPRIADATKCEEGAAANFRRSKKLHACAKPAKAEQACGGRKHGIALKF